MRRGQGRTEAVGCRLGVAGWLARWLQRYWTQRDKVLITGENMTNKSNIHNTRAAESEATTELAEQSGNE